ncbi:MAG: DNA polymerase III subunit gamma/tau [Clostridia bacterium]
MYTALYRSERPEVFDEILGQEHIVRILKHQIESGEVSHAYLFCGTRGTGKTTTARILAKGVNCLNEDPKKRPCGVCENCKAIKDGTFMDVIEIDAASNNGVENIRELRESVKYPPAVGRKKVYIIDEVHMLSPGAFNALLKTLEEPPENVMFILATTEPQKLPATILSRCLRLDFKRVPQKLLMEGMRRICEEKGVTLTESALKLLANCADGSVRDGLSVLDQVLASGQKEIDREAVLEYIGAAGEDFFIELTEQVSLRKVPEALLLVDRALADGKDVRGLMKDWMAHYRNLMITKFIRDPEDMLNMAAENLARIEEQSRHITMDEIRDAILRLSRTINEARWSTQPRILLELAIISIASGESVESQSWQSGKQYGARTSQQARTINPEQEAREQTARIAQGQAQALAEAASKPGTTHGSGADRQQAETQTKSGIAGEKQELPQAPGMRDEIAPRTQAQTQSLLSSAENEALWHAVFEEGEDGAGSFNLIRNGTFLARVSETEFEVVAKTSFAKRFAEQKRGQLESIMERKLGRGLRMICVEEKDYHALQERQSMDETCAADGSVPDPETEHLMQLAKDALGIEIEIE